ncbi:KSR2-like protein [Mya arenaria]|uniref:KSR2-like protein n=1 Tax=Mya arenaria TaxID=6604 RepID=A0ABY7DX64_MYAAR|nr:KSR2-like protein [Mya arenaria]
MSESDSELEKALVELKTLQSMIDNIEQHLKGLRTQCALNDITQKEIRGKLVVFVSKQIIIKNKLQSEDNVHDYPKTQQWLTCVGLPQQTIKGLLDEDEHLSLYSLLEQSESDIKCLLLKHKASNEDARRLNLALRNLKIATERELSGGSSTSGDSDVELHWTNPDSKGSYGDFPVRRSPRPSTSSISSSENSTTAIPAQTHSTPPSPVPHPHHTHNERLRSVGYTPPPTPPLVRTPKTKYPITPPPKKKNLLFPEYPTISRSKSQESQLAHRVQDIDPVRSGKKKHTGVGDGSLMVPHIPVGHQAMMKHQINHRYINKLLIGSTCDVCNKNMFRGKYCKYCKFKCHRDCANKESPSCGLSKELLDVVMKNMFEGASNPRRPPHSGLCQTPVLRPPLIPRPTRPPCPWACRLGPLPPPPLMPHLTYSVLSSFPISVALREWDIPYEELTSEDVIGTGRFGTVYNLCRGSSLFTLLHVRKEKFNMSKSIIIAQQVCQGMGYLHAKGIVHKDLKTKNIFFDKDKVVITDFGLFNVTKLCHANRHMDRLQIPPGWLCYQSPEIIKSLQAGAAYASTDLPFSEMSDVYAFGTVWYELLNGNWPFEQQPPESIIWQVGSGLKPSFGTIRGSKEVKLLILTWISATVIDIVMEFYYNH